MNKKNKYTLIVSAILILTGVGLIASSWNRGTYTVREISSDATVESESETQETSINGIASLESPTETEIVYSLEASLQVGEKKYKLQFNNGQSLLEAMNNLVASSEFTFKSKTYLGIGEFVYSVNGTDAKDSKYWILYINNDQAQVGVSDYKLRPGDVIRFELEGDIYK